MIGNIAKLGLLTAAAILCLVPAPGAQADVNTVMASCAGCHGKDGASTDPVSPIIAGMSATYLAETLTAYKTKERPCPATEPKAVAMCAVAGGIADADIKQIADYLAKQKFVRASQTVDGALAEKGKQIHRQSCEKCHSGNGSVADDDAGILAGQWMPYLKAQLVEFKSGARKVDPKMTAVVDRLDAAGIDALVNYYGSMK
jgi:cytochrome subunit of sulfide dehydrogenase